MSQDFSLTSFPYLETKQLQLRQATQEDIEAIFIIFSDPKVTQFHDLNTFTHPDEAKKVIERRTKVFESGLGIRWVIIHKQSHCPIGSCGFTWHREVNAAEIGYELKSQFWRKGIMSEALRAILQFGFNSREIQFIIAEIMLKNVASRKLLEKLGFKSQGIKKKKGFWKGKYHDLEQFKLLKSDFI
ncbi:MAG: GNAT family N-acetyltransferase [Cyanobacteria bacterium P01_G01_bin.67]